MSDSVALIEVLRAKGHALFSGRIDVDTGGLAGVIHLREGQVLEARLGTSTGEPALWSMLFAERAKVHAEAGRPRATSGVVLGNPAALLVRFEERVLLLTRYAEKVGGFQRVWAIRFDALAATLDDLPDAINPLLRLLDGKRTVRHVVTECALGDMLALRVLSKLLARGILVLPEDLSAQGAGVPAAGDDGERGLQAALAASLADLDADGPVVARALAPEGQPPVPPRVRPSPVRAPSLPPAAATLPRVPRPSTQADLRSWLGDEDSAFATAPQLVSWSHPVARRRLSGIGVVPLVLLLALAVGLGALIGSSW